MFNSIYEFLVRMGYTHPLHPSQVHMPIGLVVGALIFALTAAVFRREKLVITPRHCIILAFIWIFPTILFGVMDWQHYYGGAWLFPIKVKISVSFVFIGLLLAALLLARKYGSTSIRVIPVYFLCFCCVFVLGYYGGQLIFGAKAQPSPEQFKAGERIYAMNCSSCHPHGGNVINPKRPVIHSSKLDSLDDFVNWVRRPEPPMPAFPVSKISDKEARELYQYTADVLENPKK